MLAPKKRLGQNFLIDRNIIENIVSSISAPPDGRVIEIGAGTGALTDLLVDRYSNFVAVEIDERAVDLLKTKYPGLDVCHRDILDVKWAELSQGQPMHVIGNLPYNITSPILFKMIDEESSIVQATIMVQLEVAKRMIAVPRTKAYGILSVATQLAGDVKLLFRVSKNVFRPVPAVESAIVQIDFKESETRANPFIRSVIRTAFGQRRKTLRNSLKPLTSSHGKELDDKMSGRRPEELRPEEFVELADFLKDS